MKVNPESLRRARLRRGLTQEQLAQHADCKRSHISLLESGKRGASQKLLRRIAAVLEVTVGDLLL